MTKTYQIVSMTKKEAAGKQVINATLTINENGVPSEIEGVTIWSDFPGFSLLDVSKPVTGSIYEKVWEKNGKSGVNKTLYPPKPTTGRVASTKPDIAKNMEVKAKNIEHAQDRKEEGMKVSATFRDATIITAQVLAQMTATGVEWLKPDAERIWKEWREFLWKNYGDDVPFV